jgi:multidrug transporter EmrE-like cation transporter
MRGDLVFMVLLSVLLSAGSQVLLKLGMTSPPIRSAMAMHAAPLQLLLTIASSPWVLCGLFCFGLSAVVWLFVLARIPLSAAYPFVALGIVVTVLAGHFLFGEPVPALRIAGVAMILAGIAVVAAAS